jgi:nitroreductase
MDAMKAILTRRSVREFKQGTIEREKIEQILAAGMSAPSAHNEQPWCFLVIDDREVLSKLAATASHVEMAATAGAAIVVCGDLDLELTPGSWVQDCSAATQNILLAAHALGLGAVWTHCHPDPVMQREVTDLFKLADNIKPLAIVVMGEPAVEVAPKDNYLAERVHFNKW